MSTDRIGTDPGMVEAVRGLALAVQELRVDLKAQREETQSMRDFLIGNLGENSGMRGRLETLEATVKVMGLAVSALKDAIESRRLKREDLIAAAVISGVVSILGNIAPHLILHH